MESKRIIPCLDVKDGRVVKGTKFVNLKDAGDPVEIAKYYSAQGADEIALLDIAASTENRKTMLDVVARAAQVIEVPLVVGGGISEVGDFYALFEAGADKASINSAAVKNKKLLAESAKKFGSSRVILAVDAKKNADGRYTVYINGGAVDTGIDALEWALEGERLGAGEILLTSIDADGTKDGYDIELTRLISEAVRIPVIASGGCGALEHFSEVFEKTAATAALAATLFHFKELSIPQVKKHLLASGINVRL
ncbi:MAG: imidazole glycerol phosphate synthase subunit HisF [Clostridiales bacterium]|nr:imidazole glycerol phosphate synthase subunit HisF [Clostridiales bacterium]